MNGFILLYWENVDSKAQTLILCWTDEKTAKESAARWIKENHPSMPVTAHWEFYPIDKPIQFN